MNAMDEMYQRLKIGDIERKHSRDDIFAVIESGRLVPSDPATTLTPKDEFIYRWRLANDIKKGSNRFEAFMLALYGRAYIESPELLEMYYRDVEVKARQVGEIALFANLHTQSGLSAVTIGFLGDTSRYPEHVRLGAQSANFNNTLGLSGLTRVNLDTYQRVVMDNNGELDIAHSVVSNTTRFQPFIIDNIGLHDDLSVTHERKDIRVGESQIEEWANSHPDWKEYVEGTMSAVQNGNTNPVLDFEVPENTEGYRNLATFERLLDFEREDSL